MPMPLAEAERAGEAFVMSIADTEFSDVRAMPAARLLEATSRPGNRFPIAIDGYFLPKTLTEIYASGQQARVPLLAGWNSQESGAGSVLGRGNDPTPENYTRAVRDIFKDLADEALQHYPGKTNEEAQQSATDLAGDRFIGFGTWKWVTLHGSAAARAESRAGSGEISPEPLRGGGGAAGKPPVYRYFYTRPRPAMRPEKGTAGAAAGAAHSAEIEYALGNLSTNEVYAWTPDDHKVSETFQGYIVNFVKTGNPNGAGLPEWPAANAGTGTPVLRLDVVTKAEPDRYRERYLFLDRFYARK